MWVAFSSGILLKEDFAVYKFFLLSKFIAFRVAHMKIVTNTFLSDLPCVP